MHTVTITNGTEKTTIHSDNLDRISGGKIVKAVNAVDSFTFTIYPDNAGYNKLKPLTTSVTVTDDSTGKDIFIGRVLKCPDSMDEQGLICKSVTCEGRLGWLYDSVQPYAEYKVVGIRTVLASFISKHNTQVGDDKHISVGQVTVTGENNYTYSVNWVSTMDAISEQLVGKFGGEIQLRDQNGKVYIDYLEHIGHGTDTKIELAVNLKTISREVDETSVITRLYPLGTKLTDSEKRLTIGSVNGGKDYIEDSALVAKYGVISGTQTWDDVTQASILKTKATAFLKSANKAKKQYKITAVDLSTIDMNFEQFELGCWYRIVNPLMGIDEDLRIIGITINLDSPEQSELTFGDKFETMTGFMTAKTKSLQTAIDDSEFRNRQVIDSKIENATKLITGAEGGHVILDPSEKPERILIMDTADINTCKSCIQLNKNGLGFWKTSDGGSAKDGPYTNAWTIDGNLVASFITALTLTGLKINNGSGTFSVSEDGTVVANRLSSKSATITGGSISIQTSSQNTSAIQLSHNEWTLKVSPLEIRIDNSTIGGHIVLQAGAMSGYWNNELKFSLDTNSGNISTYTDSGKKVFTVDTNNRAMYLYNENEKTAIQCYGKTGDIMCNSITTKNHTLD
ncbi:MAG: phage tail protein [Ruminococcus bicirculans]|uniref:phage tail protein n=1 Tax=Ruminococcus bicirculans (ex Wegman et al. 2014) TaxID=1160721 RepID=UPI00243139BD|nr:phage tail protein [Ruminococcus bicirculans (ex Wegman et al. 2014)]MBS6819544.1 phage tail protein [Ruminococcus bicirculans (ex Wegman et al. 2014)]